MRRRKATVELCEQIRREYEFGLGTIQGVARQFGVHRRLVREAVQSAVPRQKGPPVRPRPRVEPVGAFIEGILAADRQAPRKQRHTAHRIYERLRQERPEHPIAELAVRRSYNSLDPRADWAGSLARSQESSRDIRSAGVERGELATRRASAGGR